MNDKLSAAQDAALAKLTDKWQSAYSLKVSRRTLDALVRRGLADVTGVGELGAIKYRLAKPQ